MNIRRPRFRDVPTLNTSSLPDLIFTVLFFFMIVTHMRKATVKVEYQLPQGTELTRLIKKSAVTYIYIGRAAQPSTAANGAKAIGSNAIDNRYTIQINDKYVDMSDVAEYIATEKKRMSPDDQARMTVSVKADRSTHMSIINDVKKAIRAGGASRINYSADSKNINLKQK